MTVLSPPGMMSAVKDSRSEKLSNLYNIAAGESNTLKGFAVSFIVSLKREKSYAMAAHQPLSEIF